MNKFYLSLYSYESDEERNINDAITDQFRAILQDVTVYYSKAGRTYDIAESLMEVVSESR